MLVGLGNDDMPYYPLVSELRRFVDAKLSRTDGGVDGVNVTMGDAMTLFT